MLPAVLHEGDDAYGQFRCLARVLPELSAPTGIPPFDSSCEDPGWILNMLPADIFSAAHGKARRLWNIWKKGSGVDEALASTLIDDSVRWVWHYKWLCARHSGGEVFRGCSRMSPDSLLQRS